MYHNLHPDVWPDWIRFITPRELRIGTVERRRQITALMLEAAKEAGFIQKIVQRKYDDKSDVFEDPDNGWQVRANNSFVYSDAQGSLFIREANDLDRFRNYKSKLDSKLQEFILKDQRDNDLKAIVSDMKFHLGRFDLAFYKGNSSKIIADIDKVLITEDVRFTGSYTSNRRLRNNVDSIINRTAEQTFNLYEKVRENKHIRNEGTVKQGYYKTIFEKLCCSEYVRGEIRFKTKRSCYFIEKLIFNKVPDEEEGERYLTMQEIGQKVLDRYYQYHKIFNHDGGAENELWKALFLIEHAQVERATGEAQGARDGS